MVNSNDVYDLPIVMLRLSKTIRHCAVIDKTGNVVVSKARNNLQPLLSDENSYRQSLQAAMRHFSRPSWQHHLGNLYYDASRYEKVIDATIPFQDNYLLLVSFDYNADSFDKIIRMKILPVISSIFKTPPSH